MTTFNDAWKGIDELVDNYKLAPDPAAKQHVTTQMISYVCGLRGEAELHKFKYTQDYYKRIKQTNKITFPQADGDGGDAA